MQTIPASAYTSGYTVSAASSNSVAAAISATATFDRFSTANGDNGWFTYTNSTYSVIQGFNWEKFRGIYGVSSHVRKGWQATVPFLHTIISVGKFPSEWILPSVTELGGLPFVGNIDSINDFGFDFFSKIKTQSESGFWFNYSYSDHSFFSNIDLSKTNITKISEYKFALCCLMYAKNPVFILPPRINSIGQYAFASSNNLYHVQGLPGNYSWDQEPYSYLNDITLPNSISYIGSYAFSYLFSRNSPSILVKLSAFVAQRSSPNAFDNSPITNLTSATSDQFWRYSNSSRTQVIGFTPIGDIASNYFELFPFPNTVKIIGDGSNPLNDGINQDVNSMLQVSSKFTGTLIIPRSVITINDNAFSGFNNITALDLYENGGTFAGNTGNYKAVKDLTTSDRDKYFIIVKVETTDYTRMGSPNNYVGTLFRFNGVVQNTDGIVMGYTSHFTGYNSFGSQTYTTVDIASSILKIIGERAFSGCHKLSGILKIPRSVRYIGKYAFQYCSSFSSLALNAETVIIDDYAFSNCTNLPGQVRLELLQSSNQGQDIFLGNNTSALKDFRYFPQDGDVIVKEIITHSSSNIECKLEFRAATLPFGIDYYNMVEFDNKLPPRKIYPITPIGDIPTIASIFLSSDAGHTFLINVVKDDFFSSPITLNLYNDGVGKLRLVKTIVPYFGSDYDIFPSNCNLEASTWDGLLNSEFKASLMICVFDSAINNYVNSQSNYYDTMYSLISNPNFSSSKGSMDRYFYYGNYDIIYIKDYKREAIQQSQIILQPKYYIALVVKSISNNFIISNTLEFDGQSPFTFRDDVTKTEITGFKSGINYSGTFPSIPDSVTVIADYAFQNCTNLTGQLTLPSTIVNIGMFAFSNCTGLTGQLIIPSSVTNIEMSAFDGCIGFTSLTISSGLVSIQDFAFNDCTRLTGSLNIPASVKTIGQYAFQNCLKLSGALALVYVETIGQSAFKNCSGFTSLTLSSIAQTIQPYTFSGCSGFTGTLIIPSNITNIGESAFQGCSKLSGSLTIPNSVTSIGGGAFQRCSGFNSLTIPSNVTTIGFQTFDGCSGFTGNLIIQNTVTSIGFMAFNGCSGFTGNLIIPNSVISIGGGAFQGCSGLNGTLTIPSSITRIEGDVFNRCSNLSGTLTIPNTVTSIGSGAFKGCSKFTGQLTLPDISILKTIGNEAFSGCIGFTGDLTIPSGVTIGMSAFYGCIGFTLLNIPSSLSIIENSTFENCSGFIFIRLPTTITSIGDRAFQKCVKLDIYYPSDAIIYKDTFIDCKSYTPYSNNNASSSPFTYTDSNRTEINGLTLGTIYRGIFPPIGARVTSIADNAFKDYTGIIGPLVIPSTVINIGQSAFQGCTGFSSLTISSGVQNIKTNAFLNCTGFIRTLTIPTTVSNISDGSFQNCSGFISLNILSNLTVIGNNAFQGCTGFTGTLTIPSTVTLIGNNAFQGCTGFTGTLTIPNSVTHIGSGVFQDCTGFTSLTLSTRTIIIGSSAFEGCAGFIGTLTIPNSVTRIGDGAFQNCTGFTSLTIPNSVTSIGVYAFKNCTGFTGALTIPNSVTTIGDGAFQGCSGFNSFFNISSRILTIGNDVFNGCTGFTGALTLPPNLTYIGDRAFQGCSGLAGGRASSMYDLSDTGSLAIPNSVTRIGVAAFEGCYGFRGPLLLSANLTTIGDYAFRNCTGFTGSLIIPNSVTTIGRNAFENNIAISLLSLPSNLTSIGDAAFRNCYRLSGALTIPNMVISIGEAAFLQCVAFTSLRIPNSVTSIGDRAFQKCTGFTSLTIPNSVTTIGSNTFEGCTGFTGTLKIPNSVITIRDSAFQNCTGFNSLTIPNSVTTIGNSTFSGCTGLTGLLIIPLNPTITIVNRLAFQDCLNLDIAYPSNINTGNSVGPTDIFINVKSYTSYVNIEEIIGFTYSDLLTKTEITGLRFSNYSGPLPLIPNTVTNIADGAFNGKTRLTGTFSIPSSLVSIGSTSFQGCTGLNGLLIIPSSVQNVGNNTFNGCSNLDIAYSSNTPTLSSAFNNVKSKTSYIDIEEITGFRYNNSITKTEITGLSFSNYSGPLPLIPNTVTSIGSGAFQNCSGLSGALTIPNSVRSIGSGAFQNCSGFTGTLTIPNSVTTIGSNTFEGCTGFTGALTIPNSVIDIGPSAFNDCLRFTESLTIPPSVTSIGQAAFRNCTGFTGTLTIPNSVTTIGRNAFENCVGFSGALTIPNKVTSIEFGAFLNCYGFTSLTIPNSVTIIGTGAFQNCYRFSGNLLIPSSVQTIGDGAFNTCSGFTSLTISNGVKSIGGSAFNDCLRFTESLTIPPSVTSIGQAAFRNCLRFTGSISIPSGVTTITQLLFENCYGFTSLTIPNSVTTIGQYTFINCTGLSGSLRIPDSVKTIGDGTFSSCSGLDITYNSRTTNISVHSFGGVKSLTIL